MYPDYKKLQYDIEVSDELDREEREVQAATIKQISKIHERRVKNRKTYNTVKINNRVRRNKV